MLSLDDPMILREIIMDHYENPRNRGLVHDDSYKQINMNSSTCIDNLYIQVKVDYDKVEDIRYDGEACAICTASTSIMTELLIGKTKEEAQEIIDNYMNMIYEKDYDPDILEEAIAFKNTHKQANRIKCATLGWNGVISILKEGDQNDDRK